MKFDWLTARPVAHRGLHGKGIIENSLSAAAAAIAANYAIEVDLQLSADGEIVVFHDETLDRLTAEKGNVADRTLATLQSIKLNNSEDTIPSLAELLQLVNGTVPLILELKSPWNGSVTLVHKVADVLANYQGPAAVMSFDPDLVAELKRYAPSLPRGVVAERWYVHPHWKFLSAARKQYLGMLLHLFRTRPHFIAYAQFNLPALAPTIARKLFGIPLLTWTVRIEREREHVAGIADQIIFEHIRP